MEKIKNKLVIPYLNGINSLEKVKLSGQILKVLIRNKKNLLKASEEIEEIRKRIISTHVDEEGKLVEEAASKEWLDVLEQESDVTLDKFNSGLLDQYSDLTLEQFEVLDLMTE